jgi:hypothetical protein
MERSFENIFINAMVASLEKTARAFAGIGEGEHLPMSTATRGTGEPGRKKGDILGEKHPIAAAEERADIATQTPWHKKLLESLKGKAEGAYGSAKEAVKPAGTKVKELWQSGKAGKGLLIGGGAAAAGGLGLGGAALINALRNKKKKEEAA